MPPRLRWLEVRGFRSFGVEAQRLTMDGELVLVHAPNSQGKTSIAEALEFLFTGSGSRRDLLGGAKVEYDGCLRNVHLPQGEETWVAARIDVDGVQHEICRTLKSDFGGRGEDCESELVIDGIPSASLVSLGFRLSEPPLRAPVLLQHTLRYVLSAQPQARADYFKAVLEVADLDIVRREVAAAAERFEQVPRDPLLDALDSLGRAPGFEGWGRKLRTACKSPVELVTALQAALDVALAKLAVSDAGDDLEARSAGVRAAVGQRRRDVFPLGDLSPGANEPLTALEALEQQTSDGYVQAVNAVDAEAAKLTALFSAVLAVPSVAGASDDVDCPVCETADALTAQRLQALRTRVAQASSIEESATRAQAAVGRLQVQVENAAAFARRAPAPAAAWADDQVAAQRSNLVLLGDFGLQFDAVLDAARETATAADHLTSAVEVLAARVKEADERIGRRDIVDFVEVDDGRVLVLRSMAKLDERRRFHRDQYDLLAGALRPVLDSKADVGGALPLLTLVDSRDALRLAVQTESARASTRARLATAQKDIGGAIGNVLDARFSNMSTEVSRWWATLRPDELVGFGGVHRRATGKRFLDLRATLKPSGSGAAITRNAVGVYSDSQLNALGLAAFLARSVMEATPLILLDDPVPNSDLAHRSTFAISTVQAILDADIQLVVTTFDPGLADLVRSLHQHRGVDEFELTLDDPINGTLVVKRSDEFEWLMTQAKAEMRVGLEGTRRKVATDLRSAGERLAKEVIVAGRLRKGKQCLLSDFDGKNLGDLVPIVIEYAKEADEPGRWRVLGTLLNPGSHDAPPPQNSDLVQAHGLLRDLRKRHPEVVVGSSQSRA